MRVVMLARSAGLSLADLQSALVDLGTRNSPVTLVQPAIKQASGIRAISLEAAVQDNAELVKLRTIMVGPSVVPI